MIDAGMKRRMKWYTPSNHKTDAYTFKDGEFTGAKLDPQLKFPVEMPFDAREKYTKEEIGEALSSAWDKGEYAADQTDITWIFNPDPEGFTGTVDLTTVLLKDNGGLGGPLDAYYNPQVRARCRVRIVDGAFFEKLDGSSKLADILKTHKGIFATREDIETCIKSKWLTRDFGDDASYFTMAIKED